MGLDVRFEKGVGPIVEQVSSIADLSRVADATAADRLSPVYETVRRVKAELPETTTLIGFAGAPWTVGLYAIEGRGKTDKSTAIKWAQGRPEELRALLLRIADASVEYLKRQVEAGADALMLFDSWAEGLADNVFREIIIEPTVYLVEKLRAEGVTVPIIGFPRGAAAMLPEYAAKTGVTAVGLDTAVSPIYVRDNLPKMLPVQGHLDPLLLIEGGTRLDDRVRELVAAYQDRPHIFNLGHGVRPETPIENVERVMRVLREG